MTKGILEALRLSWLNENILGFFVYMSKTKDGGNTHYELLYIISNKFTEDEVKPIADKVAKIVTEAGAAITSNQDWGKKKLATPIKSFAYGYYQLLEFSAPGAVVADLNRVLRLTNEILRHLIVVKPIKSESKIRREKAISQRIADKAAEQLKLEKEKTKGKVDLKDLDEKLDKILDTDDLL